MVVNNTQINLKMKTKACWVQKRYKMNKKKKERKKKKCCIIIIRNYFHLKNLQLF